MDKGSRVFLPRLSFSGSGTRGARTSFMLPQFVLLLLSLQFCSLVQKIIREEFELLGLSGIGSGSPKSSLVILTNAARVPSLAETERHLLDSEEEKTGDRQQEPGQELHKNRRSLSSAPLLEGAAPSLFSLFACHRGSKALAKQILRNWRGLLSSGRDMSADDEADADSEQRASLPKRATNSSLFSRWKSQTCATGGLLLSSERVEVPVYSVSGDPIATVTLAKPHQVRGQPQPGNHDAPAEFSGLCSPSDEAKRSSVLQRLFGNAKRHYSGGALAGFPRIMLPGVVYFPRYATSSAEGACTYKLSASAAQDPASVRQQKREVFEQLIRLGLVEADAFYHDTLIFNKPP
ncbi:unnamed protein product [Amoebophrya sp. A120]|nr:unnamed protein product [Amoebophrya sp. A120]|eukprot:GSA120T00010443001.1